MKTLHYAGTHVRISDGLGNALQAYLVALRFKSTPSEWYALPCYLADGDKPLRVDIQLVPNTPMIIAPSPTDLPDPEGSEEAMAELAGWTAHWLDVHYDEGSDDVVANTQ
ncbi:MAG: hypothetical protein JWM50_1742 [Microbacteriaceae bacterium]|nr:hypothetical protein [Microbacteriaceae bacterium]